MLSRRGARTCTRWFSSSSSSYYDLLKVPKTASDDEIKKAYKKAALEHHPDRGGDSDKFKEISHAYSVLSDPSKRQLYDQFGERGLDNGPGGPSNAYNGEDPMDIFSQVFSGAARRRPGGLARGRDALYNLELSLEEVASGASRSISYNRDVGCSTCGGRGATKIDPCKRCGGSGVVMTRQNIGFLVHMQTMCPDCNGEGFRVPRDGHCKPCSGSGVVGQKEVFTVNIPKGCPEGYQVRFQGKADQLPGHTAGDVVVQVRTKKHSSFTRLGRGQSPDLVIKKEISLADALAGCRLDVKPVVSGKEPSVTLGTSTVVSPNDVWVARGLGLPRFDGSTNGDLYVQFSIKFPSKLGELSEKDRERILGVLDSDKKTACGLIGSLFESKGSAPAVDSKKTVMLERVVSNDKKREVAEALSPPAQQRQQAHGPTGGYDPQQCQQQ
jgi:DnaJ family protein A protein 2